MGKTSLLGALKGEPFIEEPAWLARGDDADFDRGEGIRGQGSMLRELHGLLKEKDPLGGFGGLEQVQNKRREFLWVHPQFVDEY